MIDKSDLSKLNGNTADDFSSCISKCDYVKESELVSQNTKISERSSDSSYDSLTDHETIQTQNIKCEYASPVQTSGDFMSDPELNSLFNLQELPVDLRKLVPGVRVGLPDDYSPPINKRPEWLDMRKFELGQEFARKYFIGVNMSQMLSLYILFALPNALETLIFSRNSSTPFTSFKRYLSTIRRVASWYDYDIWSRDSLGFQNMKTVRGMHLNISKRINSVPLDELKVQVTLAGTLECPGVWSDMKQVILEDFQQFEDACLPESKDFSDQTHSGKVFVNQLDMSVTQFGFMGLMVCFPEKFGAGGATREELEGYVHMWRGICYLLGVEDEYNFCDGTFQEVVQRCHSMIEKWGKPCFNQATEEWEHMSRCLAEGMTYVIPSYVSFEATLMYMCWVLDVPAHNLYEHLTTPDKMSFHMLKFIMTTAVKVPGLLPLLNWQARRYLLQASSLSAEELKKLESKTYDYQVNKSSENKDVSLARNNYKASLLGLLLFARLLV